ncbi:MAG: chemotaxis response regulator protein-glutamate methylesterase [Lentisphaerae bacterium GWF2_44_16]|nr:MAG: chemotaxis response regulator protein-glutamate methylesterase [Lentisphaerae bacterium GWF2_44_16]
MDKLKVLIVDDSALYRKVLSDILAAFPEVELIGTASNGKMALERISKTLPDFITLDFEMPEMDGIQTLRELKNKYPSVKAVMVSAHTVEGAEVTMQALEEGAFEFIAKPNTSNLGESKKELQAQLTTIVNTLFMKKSLSGVFRKNISVPRPPPLTPPPVRPSAHSDIAAKMSRIMIGRCEIVGIGVSTGGPNALTHLVPRLPANFRVPVLIVQHMPPVFTAALADSLNKKSAVQVLEGVDGIQLKSGTVYIAPGGKQMKVEKSGNSTVLRITDDPPENNCRPSVDYMFRSIASCYKGNSLGVIMTGMGADGVKGLAEMKKTGTKVIAQDEATCTVYGMPMEAVKSGVVDLVVPLDQIVDEIISAVR